VSTPLHADALFPSLPDPVLDGSVKGWPALGARASEIAPGRLTLEDLPTPLLYLRQEALGANILALSRWCEQRRIVLAPHAKTTMAPALLTHQLDAGACGLTVADVRQARVALASGARCVLIANEVVRDGDLRWLAAFGAAVAAGDVPAARVSFCLDSITGLELAQDAHRRFGGPPLRVLIELGYPDGRCGVRDVQEALALARAVAESPHLALCGIETYEGLMPPAPKGDADADARAGALARVDQLLMRAARLAEGAARFVEDDQPILTAGGSAYFDRVAALLREPCDALGWQLCLRSGCYVTHDHGLYAQLTPSNRDAEAPRFQAAIEVRASVLSRPQADKLILDCGRRDVSYDAGLPVVLVPPAPAAAMTLTQLNDEHAHVALERDCDIAPGATVTLGISHPCTALERWRVLALVDRSDRVLAALPTCF